MKHGEIRWVEMPDRGGREQQGRRPGIIWQDTQAFSGLPTLLIIPLTSRVSALRFPATWRLEATESNRLPAPSVALVFQLGACDVRRIGQRLGSLDPTDLSSIQQIAKQLQKIT